MLITIIILVVLLAAALTYIVIASNKFDKVLKTYSQTYNDYEEARKEDQRMLRSYEITFDNYQNDLVTLKDELPKKHDPRSLAMKLANELEPYFKIDEENGTVSIIVYKGTNV